MSGPKATAKVPVGRGCGSESRRVLSALLPPLLPLGVLGVREEQAGPEAGGPSDKSSVQLCRRMNSSEEVEAGGPLLGL